MRTFHPDDPHTMVGRESAHALGVDKWWAQESVPTAFSGRTVDINVLFYSSSLPPTPSTMGLDVHATLESYHIIFFFVLFLCSHLFFFFLERSSSQPCTVRLKCHVGRFADHRFSRFSVSFAVQDGYSMCEDSCLPISLIPVISLISS